MNQNGKEEKKGAECTRQVKLGKQVKMFTESGRQCGRILLGIRGDVQTTPVWKGVCESFVNNI